MPKNNCANKKLSMLFIMVLLVDVQLDFVLITFMVHNNTQN